MWLDLTWVIVAMIAKEISFSFMPFPTFGGFGFVGDVY
jgi:hypothetical protein